MSHQSSLFLHILLLYVNLRLSIFTKICHIICLHWALLAWRWNFWIVLEFCSRCLSGYFWLTTWWFQQIFLDLLSQIIGCSHFTFLIKSRINSFLCDSWLNNSLESSTKTRIPILYMWIFDWEHRPRFKFIKFSLHLT